MKKYKFLLFDLDYTLLDFDADMVMAFERLYRSQDWDQHAPYSPAMLDLYERHNNAWWRKFENGECSKSELFRGRFVDFLAETGLSGDPDRLNELYFDFLGQGGMAYPGALELLERLSQDHAVYIITNGNAPTARSRIERSGVGRCIRDYFVSEAIGYAKPDQRYFTYVEEHIPGFDKQAALVIGDSLLSDIQGAANAGLDSLWFHPPGRSWEAGKEVPYTYRADSYEKIWEIVTHDEL